MIPLYTILYFPVPSKIHTDDSSSPRRLAEVPFTKFNLRLRLAFIKFLGTTFFYSESGPLEFATLLLADLLRKSPSVPTNSSRNQLLPLSVPPDSHFLRFWSSPRPISGSQLHALLHFHPCPIHLVVSEGSYSFRMGSLILGGASRLDAFSVYPSRASPSSSLAERAGSSPRMSRAASGQEPQSPRSRRGPYS